MISVLDRSRLSLRSRHLLRNFHLSRHSSFLPPVWGERTAPNLNSIAGKKSAFQDESRQSTGRQNRAALPGAAIQHHLAKVP